MVRQLWKFHFTDKSELSIKDTIQNFQLSIVRLMTYSSNISCIRLSRLRDTGAPVAGNMDWQLLQNNKSWQNRSRLDVARKYLIEVLSDSICWRSESISSRSWLRSVLSWRMYSAPFWSKAAFANWKQCLSNLSIVISYQKFCYKM